MQNFYFKHLFTALLLLCATVATAHDFEVGGIYYNKTSTTDFTVEVTYRGSSYDEYSYEYSGNVVIPESVTYNGITYSVTSIGVAAFRDCSGLTGIEIPNSVTSIGGSAFAGTAWYNNQPDGVVYAGKVLYKYKGTMSSNTSIAIKDGTLGISGSAFFGCSGLTGVVIPNSVTSIGGSAFFGCSGLTGVVIPNSVTSIGGFAFYGCSGLKEVHISDLSAWCGIEFGDYYANPLYYAHNLYLNGELVTDLVIPDGVTEIKRYAFYGCSSLTSVVIPNSVTSIGAGAFDGCSGLTSVVIPNSVTSIGSYAFRDCSGLTSVTIGNSVTSIGSYAFSGCSSLTSVEIANSVTNIGERAFSYCSGLKSVVIPNSVTSIGSSAFYDCSGLKKVINFSSLTFSKGSTANGYVAYYADTVINAPNGPVEGDFVFAVIDGVNTLCFYIGAGGDVTLPADYKGENYAIGADVFNNNTSLTSVVIPNSVTSIGDNAFDGCSSLKKVINFSSLKFSKGSTDYGYVAYYAETVINAPNGPVEGDFVFAVIDGVNTLCAYIGVGGDVTLPADYKGENYAIGADVFNNNTSLTGVVIPAAVTSIGTDVFSNCRGLKEVHISDLSAWCEIDFSGLNANPLYYAHNLYLNGELVTDLVIPDGVTVIKRYAFEGCRGLTGVVIPNSVTSIGMCAFDGCTGLTSVVVGNSVTSIGEWAFYNCRSLTSVVIPASVTSIGDYAFRDCRGLTGIISMIPAEDLFSVTNYTFDYNCVLYVPKGAKETYASTGGWSKFKNIVETDFTGIDEVKGENGKVKDVYYDLNGRAVERPANGLYIKNGKKVFVK